MTLASLSPTAWILIAVGIVLLLWIVRTWNRFVRLENRTNEAFSGMDVQLKRRADLVPNLVEVVKGYAAHESDTLEAVVRARAGAGDATTLEARATKEGALAGKMRKLFLLVEQYPELRADSNFRGLHEDLVEIEEGIQYARRYYNGAVRDLNTAVQSFPANLIAGVAGKKARAFFELDDAGDASVPPIDWDA